MIIEVFTYNTGEEQENSRKFAKVLNIIINGNELYRLLIGEAI